MNKMVEKNKQGSMHSHIETAYKLMNEHLPICYIEEVKKILPAKDKKNITDRMISNVRCRRQNPEKQMQILNALVKVAKANKKLKEDLVENLKN